MQSVFLVRSEHLNHQGHLFGGDLMAEIDTVAYCLLRQDFPGHTFVTRAAQVEFLSPAHLGDAILFEARTARIGQTSIEVEVTGTCVTQRLCVARMTYVNLGPDGRKALVRAPGSRAQG